MLAERGKRSDGLYVLLAGNVTATGERRRGDAHRARQRVRPRLAAWAPCAADVTVRATTEAVLLRLPAAKFSSLAATYRPALALLAETAEKPLRASVLPE